jgi:hypothetical protein
MTWADAFAALLERERCALEAGDHPAVAACAAEKEQLLGAHDGASIEATQASDLVQRNRRNGQLARNGLRLVRQVLGTEAVGYGPRPPTAQAVGNLSKRA